MAATTIKDGFGAGSDNQLKVNSDGSINVNTSGGGGSSNVNIHDSSGNPINSTGGALDVTITGGSSTITGTVTSNEAGLTSFQTEQYSIGTSVVQLTPTPLTNRSSVSLRVIATGSNAVYIGNSNAVTVSSGYPLYNGDTLQMDLTPAQTIYAVANVAGQTVAVLEIA